MTVAVVGLGKIGLPLAVQYAMSGETVIGVDINPSVVDQVNAGIEPFPGEARLGEFLRRTVDGGRLRATTDTAGAVAAARTVVVVVPLFVDRSDAPDFGWMDAATAQIGRGLTRGTLVLYETTLPVGTTRDRWRPMLERTSGLQEGIDFHVAFSPERVLTGRVFSDLRKYPKLVGGLSDEGTKLATEFYERVLQFDDRADLDRANGVWALSSAESAELAKLAETTYRDVNIGLANQFAKFADRSGIDIYEVIEASNSQPYSHLHRPGIAVGGHCIPVYPRLYLWGDPEATVVRAARRANSSMPEYCLQRVQAALGSLDGLTVLILGVAYRGGVKETAFSGALDLARLAAGLGAMVVAEDPLYSAQELEVLGFRAFVRGERADVVILQADHHEYETIRGADFPGARLFVDGRPRMGHVRCVDIATIAVGRPGQ